MSDAHGAGVSPPTLDERRRIRGLVCLGLSIFALNLGIHVHMTTNVNFLNDLLEAGIFEQGYLEAIRETCGVLSFFVLAMFLGRSEAKTAAVMLLVTGLGLAAYFSVGRVWQLIAFSLFWSFGFHLWMPLAQSMQLALAAPGRVGFTLGRLRAVGAAGVLTGLGGVWLLRNLAGFDMRKMFLVAGALTALGALPCFLVPETQARRPARMGLARALCARYRLYCVIELLEGMRKQVFLLFAVLVLVREHGVQFDTIAVLMLISQGICLVLGPAAGRAADRFGERAVLSVYFSVLAVLFLLYALVRERHHLYVVYVLDHAMFSLRVAIPTYANRIAAEGERTQLLAMGVTMNHVGAVTLPLVGGALYAAWGPALPFYCGCGVALVSLAVAQRVRRVEADPADARAQPEK